MKKYLIIALIFIPFSCVAQKREISSKSTIKLEGKNTNIREWIDKKQIRWGSYWGVYRIEQDTIIGQYLSNFHGCDARFGR